MTVEIEVLRCSRRRRKGPPGTAICVGGSRPAEGLDLPPILCVRFQSDQRSVGIVGVHIMRNGLPVVLIARVLIAGPRIRLPTQHDAGRLPGRAVERSDLAEPAGRNSLRGDAPPRTVVRSRRTRSIHRLHLPEVRRAGTQRDRRRGARAGGRPPCVADAVVRRVVAVLIVGRTRGRLPAQADSGWLSNGAIRRARLIKSRRWSRRGFHHAGYRENSEGRAKYRSYL